MNFKFVKMNKYTIVVDFGLGNVEYVAHRNKNKFLFDHQSTIGCSELDIRSKFLISYFKK